MRVLITRAWGELELTGASAALAMLDDARRQARALADPALVALTHIQEGLVLGRAGDAHGSVRALERVGDDEYALDPSQRAALHVNLGLSHTAAGDLDKAAAALELAATLAAENGLVEQEFKARHNLACVAFVDGDLPRALTLMREADAMEATVSRDRARLDHAEVLLAAGLVDGARSELADALGTARRHGHRLEEGEISLRLARSDLLAGDLDGARRHLRRATAAYRSRQADGLVAEAELVRAVVDVAEGRDLPDVVTRLAARTDHRSPGRSAESASDRDAVRLEAEARLLLGDVDGAERRLSALDAGTERTLAGALHEVLVRARLDLARGRPEAAAERLESGNRILAAHQFQSASLEVRAGLALHGRQVAALDVERALGTGDPDSILTTVERWRAISHRINPVTAPGDAELAAATRELRRLRRLLADGEGEPGLGARVADLEGHVAQREWSLAVEGVAGTGTQPVTAAEARTAARRTGSTVVEFFESGADLMQVVVSGEDTHVVRLGAVDDVAALVTRLRRDLRARAGIAAGSPMAPVLERATSSSLTAADTALNPSGASDGRVVVVPSRSLAGMPWSLMPSLRGRPVTVAPSVTRWARGPADRAEAPGSEPVAALYGPGLTRTVPEIRSVLEAWQRPVPDEVEVTTSDGVIAALGSARVVHLAAHGTHEGQSPLFSSVRMADGPVFAHEFPRPVVAEHVVLSACDVGQFSTRAGDEPLGLAIALLSLGARSVLAAVAPVADEVAHDAMVAYHRLLAGGADSARAWATVVEAEPAAGVFCLYGSDWSAAGTPAGGLR